MKKDYAESLKTKDKKKNEDRLNFLLLNYAMKCDFIL